MSARRTRKRKLATLLDTMIKQKFEAGDNSDTVEQSGSTLEADLSHLHLPGPETKRIRSDTSEEATTSRIVNNIGVKGFNLLVQLSNHIPQSFKSLKVQCSQHILTTGCKRIFEDEEVQQLLADVDSIPELNSEIFGKPPDTILWEATHAYGLPMLAFLGPPVTNCLSCNSPLQENHRPTSVVCYTLDGPIPALKITLRCRACQINYRYSQYGSKDDGYTYYRDHVRQFVEASQVCYIERRCCELWNAAR